MITKDALSKDLETLYSKINSEGREAIANGQEKIDPILNQLEKDRRLGLSLLISIQGPVTNNFQIITDEIHKVEPEQYYYPLPDLHVTILDLISANDEFRKNDPKIRDFASLVENAVKDFTVFDINFSGIITGNAAILAKGFYGPEFLLLRNQLRENALTQGIPLQERYQSLSAHSTFVRFKSGLQHREKLLAITQKYHDFKLGVFQVNELDLMIHDWYNRKREIVGKYTLKKVV